MRAALLVVVLLSAAAQAQEPPPAAAPPSLEELQREYERIRGELFAARARAAALSQTVLSSKVQIYLRYTTPRFFHVTRASIKVDGASVYEDLGSAVANDNVMRFDGFVAPGKHQVTLRIDAETKDDPSYATSTESTFTIDVPARKVVILRADAEDQGDMGYSWGKKSRGSYRLHLDVGVEARALDEKGKS
jgi:hypothetical protein